MTAAVFFYPTPSPVRHEAGSPNRLLRIGCPPIKRRLHCPGGFAPRSCPDLRPGQVLETGNWKLETGNKYQVSDFTEKHACDLVLHDTPCYHAATHLPVPLSPPLRKRLVRGRTAGLSSTRWQITTSRRPRGPSRITYSQKRQRNLATEGLIGSLLRSDVVRQWRNNPRSAQCRCSAGRSAVRRGRSFRNRGNDRARSRWTWRTP